MGSLLRCGVHAPCSTKAKKPDPKEQIEIENFNSPQELISRHSMFEGRTDAKDEKEGESIFLKKFIGRVELMS